MTKRRLFTLTAAAVAGLALALIAGLVLTAPDTAIPWSVFSSGGGTSSSANFRNDGVAGQSSPIGQSSSANFGLAAGFSPGVGATVVAPTPTPTPSGPTPTPGGPDLVGAIAGPGSACPGQAIAGQVTLSVSNLGQGAAGTFSVGVYISADATITTSDLLLTGGREFVSSLNGGTTVPVPLGSGSVPVSTPLGAMFLGLLVDEFNAVAESDETNNDSAVPINIKPCALDSDNDGCTDVREQQPKSAAATGGGRNPLYYWDFMDMWVNKQKDRRVNIIDIGVIVNRFGDTGNPGGDPLDPPQALAGYHVSADRSPPIGPNLWNAGPPDGNINIIEIGLAVVQFGHNCN